jgi:hypothetical protein
MSRSLSLLCSASVGLLAFSSAFADAPVASDFQIAQRKAIDAMHAMKEAQAIERETKDDRTMRQKFEQAAKAVLRNRQLAISLLETALDAANSETPIDDVNRARYYLCYLKFNEGKHREAGAVGEYVAKQFPASPFALPCAKIAMGSYLAIYDAKNGGRRGAEASKVKETGEFIIKTWPNDPYAAEARKALELVK